MYDVSFRHRKREFHDILAGLFTCSFYFSERPVMYTGGGAAWGQFQLPHQVSMESLPFSPCLSLSVSQDLMFGLAIFS